jgi:hypothetical protein
MHSERRRTPSGELFRNRGVNGVHHQDEDRADHTGDCSCIVSLNGAAESRTDDEGRFLKCWVFIAIDEFQSKNENEQAAEHREQCDDDEYGDGADESHRLPLCREVERFEFGKKRFVQTCCIDPHAVNIHAFTHSAMKLGTRSFLKRVSERESVKTRMQTI